MSQGELRTQWLVPRQGLLSHCPAPGKEDIAIDVTKNWKLVKALLERSVAQ